MDENGTEISHTEPHHFLQLNRSISYFRTNSNSVRNSEHQIRNRDENSLDNFFLTVFYFSTFNSQYPKFEIRFKPNLAPKSPALEKLYHFRTISDKDNFYMKIVALDEIYNFLVFSFFHLKSLRYSKAVQLCSAKAAQRHVQVPSYFE